MQCIPLQQQIPAPTSLTTISMATSQIDLTRLNDEHLHLPISRISLVCHLMAQGVCDERYDLSKVKYAKVPPQKANHFSMALTVTPACEGGCPVFLDVIQDGPCDTKRISSQSVSALIRLVSKTTQYPDLSAPYVAHCEARPGTTVEDVMDCIVANGLNRYAFFPVHKQKAGCRYWMYVLACRMEKAGMVQDGWSRRVFNQMAHYWEMVQGYQSTRLSNLPDLRANGVQDAKFTQGIFYNPYGAPYTPVEQVKSH